MSAIVVVGSANMDLVVRQARLPEPGETIFGTTFSTVPGGKGLNQAVAAARAGGDVSFVGAVGADAFGRELRECLERDGINTAALTEVSAPTGTAHISVLESGENAIVVVPDANAAITELDATSRSAIEAADYVVAQFERPVALITEAFTLARAVGATTVLTPAPVLVVDDALLKLVSILVPNAAEACELAGLADEREAAVALSRLVDTVVMTRGARGVLVVRAGEVVADLPARRVEPVDTTGAGDTFTGVLVARLSHGETLEDALEAAGVAASISVTRHGATSSMPRWAEISAARG